MAVDCLFCAIIAGTAPAVQVHEDDDVVAFNDINPQAPTHILVVSRQHYADIGDISRDAAASAGLLRGIQAVVAALGLTDYRTVFNTGRKVGQSVFHVHGHVLSGRPMGWPPG